MLFVAHVTLIELAATRLHVELGCRFWEQWCQQVIEHYFSVIGFVSLLV